MLKTEGLMQRVAEEGVQLNNGSNVIVILDGSWQK